MTRIIDLLNHKNHYLEKFYSLNEDQLMSLAKSDFATLEEFYQGRESILEAIRYIDAEIDIAQNTEVMAPTDTERREATTCLAIKEEYVSRILAQDLEILACIEAEKSTIIRELQDAKKSKKAVSSYKSKPTTSRLDEEA